MSQISNQLPFHVTMHTACLPWDELIGRLWWAELRVYHEEHVGKSRAKVDAINVMVTRGLGGVHITAFRAVELYHWLTRDIRETWRERWGQGRERERERRGGGRFLHGVDMVSLEWRTYRKNSLILTENTRTVTKVTTLVFFNLHEETPHHTHTHTHTHTLSLSHTHIHVPFERGPC